jgi:hypothetical protein
MVVVRTVGNKEEIVEEKQDRIEWEIFIGTIADKSEDELSTWFSNHFSGLSQDIRIGLELIVKALWANAKVTKKLWQKIDI